MARLPQPGADDGVWGNVLNDFLSQAHATDGALKADAVTASSLQDNSVASTTLQDGSVTAPKLSASGGATGDVLVRDTGVAGGVKWEAASGGSPSGAAGGDLGGTYPNPTVPGLATKVTANGAITGATHTKITYDSKGLVTAGVDATQDDIGDGTTFKQYSATEKTKLAGIADGATANSSDATLLARANHTGTQAASTISDFSAAADARIAAASINALANVTLSSPSNGQVLKYNGAVWVNDTDATGGGVSDGDKGDITVSGSGAVWTVDNDAVTYAKMQNVSATDRFLGRDTAGAGDVEEIAPAAARAILNVADGATANSSDATLLARANHTGTQTASTISDFDTAADARITAATGTSVQPLDTQLTAIAALSPSANQLAYFTDASTAALATITSFARTLMDDVDATAARSTLALGNVNNTSDANKPVSTAQQTALDGKANTSHTHAAADVNSGTLDIARIPTGTTGTTVSLGDHNHTGVYLPIKNGISAITDSTNDTFATVNITDDATATAGWPDRLAFFFEGTRTGYHNEYGEIRARPAKINTVAFRAQRWNGASTVDILQVTSSDNLTVYFGVGPTEISMSVPIDSTANIATTGTVTGSNIGNKVTSSATAPGSPAVGDVWVDTSA